ncbi:DUF2975 domain-containing protein [Dysosmobacter sp.]|uniref:DUF2975 domain-containing protein n=1 Tax=Dysosmobacter sp. TaxID=2591382 RepID=UPI002A964E99|nr:DUF2975 domain-containing protein [Dysosmobacter sp.]MDY5613530.1 DUF2975 domain-containing protein [Dysosmobacter sp.]
MKQMIPKKIAKTLRVLLLIAFICDLLILPLVPVLVILNGIGPLGALVTSGIPDLPAWMLAIFIVSWMHVWTAGGYTIMLTLFLLFSGVCAAVILWQGRRVLRTILRSEPFSPENAVSLKRAGVCSFLISGAALVRTGSTAFLKDAGSALMSYTALFIPLFAMAGLLFLLMSGLFGQASDMKAENDLTI